MKNLKKIKKTERILQNLDHKRIKNLDKSYAIIEFPDYETKLKALSSDLRLFGIYINGNICMIDDADKKLTLTCNNVHWGSSINHFTTEINSVLEKKNMSGN